MYCASFVSILTWTLRNYPISTASVIDIQNAGATRIAEAYGDYFLYTLQPITPDYSSVLEDKSKRLPDNFWSNYVRHMVQSTRQKSLKYVPTLDYSVRTMEYLEVFFGIVEMLCCNAFTVN